MDGAPAGTLGDQGITPDELRLAARNHGLPLEALREPITPAGLHYLLIHYDIPAVDPATSSSRSPERWSGRSPSPSTICGHASGVDMPITFECAGNGRALLEPRPVSQPWLTEAVGTAEWGGTPLAPLLEEAGVNAERGRARCSRASTAASRAATRRATSARCRSPRHGDALLAYDMNGAPLPPQHGFPLRLVVPGWYGMTEREVARAHHRARGAVHGLPELGGLPDVRRGRRAGRAGHAHAAALADGARPAVPDFMTRDAPPRSRPSDAHGPRLVRPRGRSTRVEVSTDGGATLRRRRARPSRSAPTPGAAGASAGTRHPGEHVLSSRATDAAGNTQPLDPPWNLKGYANNAVERITVQVAP